MYPTRLLRRVVHYLWECHREPGEMKIRLEHPNGDRLQIEEQIEPPQVTIRHWVMTARDVWVKQSEVICHIARYGDWIPLVLAEQTPKVLAAVTAEEQVVSLNDKEQLAAAGFCDAWALQLLTEGWLALAAKRQPLPERPARRTTWPQPTIPRPDLDTIEEWMWEDGGCEATDGCWVEIDGLCPHGHPSWLLRLGLV